MNNKVLLRARIKLAAIYTIGVVVIFIGGFLLNTWLDKILAEPSVDPLLFVAEGLTILLVAMLSFYASGRTLKSVETSYQRQKKFVADVAHELRTPLSVMKTGIETTKVGASTTRVYEKLSDELLEEVNSMTVTVNDLLFLAENENRPNPISDKVDLGALVRAQAKAIRPYALNRNIALHDNIQTCSISGNAADLKRLVANLLRNAIDYNQAGGSVNISIQKTDQAVVFSVADTGIGIAKAVQTRIFDRFYKVDQARTQSSSGAGLGLAIAQEIAHAHQARIAIDSHLGKGTIVTVTFPII